MAGESMFREVWCLGNETFIIVSPFSMSKAEVEKKIRATHLNITNADWGNPFGEGGEASVCRSPARGDAMETSIVKRMHQGLGDSNNMSMKPYGVSPLHRTSYVEDDDDIQTDYLESSNWQELIDGENSRDQRKIKNICNEASATALMTRRPCVVMISANDELYLEMPDLGPVDLNNYLYNKDKSSKRLSWTTQQQLASSTLFHVDEVLREGLLHNDIKPENLIIKQDREGIKISLCDFGHATLHGVELVQALDGLDSTKRGGMGSPYYAAPEVDASKAPSEKSEVYSLALVLAEIFGYNLKEAEIQVICSATDLDRKRMMLSNPALDAQEREVIETDIKNLQDFLASVRYQTLTPVLPSDSDSQGSSNQNDNVFYLSSEDEEEEENTSDDEELESFSDDDDENEEDDDTAAPALFTPDFHQSILESPSIPITIREEIANFLTTCRHEDAAERPSIQEMKQFFDKLFYEATLRVNAAGSSSNDRNGPSDDAQDLQFLINVFDDLDAQVGSSLVPTCSSSISPQMPETSTSSSGRYSPTLWPATGAGQSHNLQTLRRGQSLLFMSPSSPIPAARSSYPRQSLDGVSLDELMIPASSKRSFLGKK